MSAFAQVGSIPPQEIWDGVLARSVHGDRVTLGLIELAPGTVVPEHSHENEQVGILLRGSVRFRIGEETRELVPGDTWCIRAHVLHDVVTGPDGAALVEVFSPARSDWASVEQQPPRPPLLPF